MTENSYERSIPGFLSDIQKSTTTTKKEKKGEEDENEGSLVLVIAERRTERVTTTKIFVLETRCCSVFWREPLA